MDHFSRLRKLPRGWDGYDATPPDARCLETAKRLFDLLPGPWTVGACTSGGLHMTQQRARVEIEIYITPSIEPPR